MSADEHEEIVKEMHNIALQVAMVKTKQEDNHLENKAIIKMLVDKVTTLPCSSHIEKFRQLDEIQADRKGWQKIIVTHTVAIVLSLVGALYFFGALVNRVEANEMDIKDNKMELKLYHDNHYKVPALPKGING